MLEMRLVVPLGMLGYGVPKDSFMRAMATDPHFIALDAGSTDAGPQKLGAGIPDVSREVTKRDLSMMLAAAIQRRIPLIIGSAGGAGARPHVEWTLGIVRELCQENDWHPKTGVIWADVDRSWLKTQVRHGKVTSLTRKLATTETMADEALNIVGQMGAEPIISALDQGYQVIIAGRSLDSAVSAAPLLREGFDPGLAWQMGELVECGAMCCTPATGPDCVVVYMRKDHFVIEPSNPKRSCTPLSVATHSLWERGHPYEHPGPGFVLRTEEARYVAIDPRRVRVTGGRLQRVAPVKVKLEGSRLAGFRTLVIGGVRDPIQIREIDEEIQSVRRITQEYFSDISTDEYHIMFHCYGKNGTMGSLEPEKMVRTHELGLVLDVVARTQELADQICSFTRATLSHYMYKDIRATGANLAFPTAPSDIRFGPVYQFHIYHVVEVNDPNELFRIEGVDL